MLAGGQVSLPKSIEGRVTILRRAKLWERVRDHLDAAGITTEDLFSESTQPVVTRARADVMCMLQDELSWSLPRIGEFFGKHHSTVLYAIRRRNERVAALRSAIEAEAAAKAAR